MIFPDPRRIAEIARLLRPRTPTSELVARLVASMLDHPEDWTESHTGSIMNCNDGRSMVTVFTSAYSATAIVTVDGGKAINLHGTDADDLERAIYGVARVQNDRSAKIALERLETVR